MATLPAHYTCHFCKLSHRAVEAGGIFHCPNPLCTGSGAAWFRSRLESYREDGSYKHTIDSNEALRAVKILLPDLPHEVRRATEKSMASWKERATPPADQEGESDDD